MNQTEAKDKVIYRSRPKRKKREWRDHPDSRIHGYTHMPRAESLSPTARTMSHAIGGDPQAIAIIDSWRGCLGWQNLLVSE